MVGAGRAWDDAPRYPCKTGVSSIDREAGWWGCRQVGGVVGGGWTMAWLALGNTLIIEGYARAGMAFCMSPFDSVLPVRIPLEHLVREFDVWLHSM